MHRSFRGNGVNKSKAEKRSIIKSILNGTFSLAQLREPRWYFVEYDDDEIYKVEGKELNKEQYEQWRKGLSDKDNIMHFHHIRCEDHKTNGNAPLLTETELATLYRDSTTPRLPIVAGNSNKEIEAKEVPANSFKSVGNTTVIPEESPGNTPVKKKKVELYAIPLPTEGKMSEYGITWGLSDEFKNSLNRN